MEVKIDDFIVLKDGSIVCDSKQTITFGIEDLTLKFDFKKDEGGEKRVSTEQLSPKTLLLHVYNFNNVFGTGFSNPIEVATLGKNYKVFVLFAVHSITEELKVFHYTLLKRPVTQEGGKDE